MLLARDGWIRAEAFHVLLIRLKLSEHGVAQREEKEKSKVALLFGFQWREGGCECREEGVEIECVREEKRRENKQIENEYIG